MTVYVLRDGRLVIKNEHLYRDQVTVDFPTPMLSRFTAMESPVTGREITSWRERDRDMRAADACDPRDIDRGPFEKRKQDAARPADDIWTDPA